LLDISSIQTGKIELSLQQYDYNKIIKHCIEMNLAFANNKEIRINFTPNTTQNICNIEIDPTRIEQVVSNLLSNAIKYSNKDTEIKIILSCEGNEVKTEVIDNGIGIPENEIDSLFQPFHITSNKSTGGEKSTGLGLAISKKVIDLHNGKIGVLSKKGKGSNFYFTLPKKQKQTV
jgi:signal transduction histidine kinase